MERSGKVIITRCGTDVLNCLDLQSPVVRFALQNVLQFCTLRGDGSKCSVVLLKRLLSALQNHYPSNSQVNRLEMIRTIRDVRANVLPELEKQFIANHCCVIATSSDSFRTVLTNITLSFFKCQFPKLIAKNLTNLIVDWVYHESNGTETFETIKKLRHNFYTLAFQVYKFPLSSSKLTEGFILSRDFKYVSDGVLGTINRILLWSINLVETSDELNYMPTIEVQDGATFMQSILHKNQKLIEYIKVLKKNGITVIVSKTLFPEWAVSICKLLQISVVDMVPGEEFDFIVSLTSVCPVTSFNEMDDKNQFQCQTSRVQLGNEKYVRLGLQTSQMVVCGTTVTECNTFCSALQRAAVYIDTWHQDSRRYSFSSGRDGTNDLYISNSFGYVELMSTVAADSLRELLQITDSVHSIIRDLLLEIPLILYRSRYSRKRKSFLKYITDIKMNKSNISHLDIQNPLIVFAILENVFTTAEKMLKIDNIVTTSKSIKSLHYKEED